MHDNAEYTKISKQDSKIKTFDDYTKKQENIEQPRLFKFKIRNKENILDEKKINIGKDSEKKNNNTKSFLTGIFNF